MINEHVLTKAQMVRLEKEFGVDTSDATFHYIHRDNDELCSVEDVCHEDDDVYTYTLTDLLKKLPNEIAFYTHTYNLAILPSDSNSITYARYDSNGEFEEYIELEDESSPLFSAYYCFLWCLKNNHIKK